MMREWMQDWFGRGATVTREATVQTPLRLELRTSGGGVVIRGVAGDTAVVRAQVERGSFHRDDGARVAELIAAGIVFEGDGLSIESPQDEGVTVHYDVSVPYAALAELYVRNGPMEVQGIEGPLEVRLTNGPLHVEDVGGAVAIELRNGPLQLRNCRGAVEVEVRNGPIHIEDVAGPLEARVRNGPVAIEDVRAGVEADAVNGPITYRGAVGGDFNLHATRGGIVLQLPVDARFELDAEADRGEVYCDFDVHDAGTGSDTPAPRVVLRTERGEIRLEQSSRAGAHSRAAV
jgi:hypothetical protein